MEANSLFKRSPSRIAARHMRPSGEEPGAQAWEACMLRIHYRSMTQAKKQGSDCWRLPSLLSLSQTTQRCSQRTPAGRAQWISGPSPWPLGHAVMLVPASHIQHKVYTSRPHGHLSQHLRATRPNCPAIHGKACGHERTCVVLALCGWSLEGPSMASLAQSVRA